MRLYRLIEIEFGFLVRYAGRIIGMCQSYPASNGQWLVCYNNPIGSDPLPAVVQKFVDSPLAGWHMIKKLHETDQLTATEAKNG